MTRQEYKQRYLYIFKMTDKPEVVIGRHLEHSHSHRLIQPSKSEVSITLTHNSSAVNEVFDHAKLSVHK